MQNNNDRLENDPVYQEFNEKDIKITVDNDQLSTEKSSSKKNKGQIVLRAREIKYYFFVQGEKFGIGNINKNENDTTNKYYYLNGENFYLKNIVIESIDNSKVYISTKVHENSIELSFLGLDAPKQLNETDDKFINGKKIKFIYEFKGILFYASMDSFPAENPNNEICRKIDIKAYFPENCEYKPFFISEFLKAIDEYKLKRYNFSQIKKDILFNFNYFVFLHEKIKAIEILLSIKYQKMLVGIRIEEVNYTSILLEEYIDRYKTEREPNGLIYEFNNYYDNIETNMPTE